MGEGFFVISCGNAEGGCLVYSFKDRMEEF